MCRASGKPLRIAIPTWQGSLTTALPMSCRTNYRGRRSARRSVFLFLRPQQIPIESRVHENFFYMYNFKRWPHIHIHMIAGSLEVKLPTIWTDGKAEVGRVREEKSRREKIREEKEWEERRCRWRNTVFCQRFVAPEGREVGSLKRRVRSHVVRWEMNSCTPLWREAHLQVKKLKAPHVQSTLEVQMSKRCTPLWREARLEVKSVKNWWVRSTFWKLRCRKSACRCGAKHIPKSKCTKHVSLGALLEVEMFKKCTRLWREAHFQVKMLKAPHAWTTFEDSDVVLRGRLKGFCTLPKVSKTWGFVACPKTMAGVGHFKRIWKDAFCVAGAVQKTCSSEMLGGQGADFLRGVAFWSVRSSGLLRWFCVTGAAIRMTWHHLCVAGAALYTDGVEKSKTHWYEAVSSALSFPFLKEVSQNCFVFDVVNFENESRRIASFLKPSSSKNENVSQNCFVFKLAERQIDT